LIGVVPDESNLYPELTGLENLNFCAALYGMPKDARQTRARELLNDFGLGQAADRKFGGYSKGMKRKLTIAAGIIHQPPILFLDEPTTGIDVASARQIRGLIKQLNQSGCTVFLTTHYLEEAERLCDRIAFIVDGRIVRIDSVANLMQDFQGRNIIQFELNGDTSDVCSRLDKDFADYACELISSTRLRLSSDRPMDLIPLIQFFKGENIEVIEARKIGPSLEDVFVQITGLETEALNNGPPDKDLEKGRENENLDRVLEYSSQRHGHVLSETAQYQLGSDLSFGLDHDVFYQVGRRVQYSRHPARRGGAVHFVRHHVHAGGHRDVRKKGPVVRTFAAGPGFAERPHSGQNIRGHFFRHAQRPGAAGAGIVFYRSVQE
jgi:ABC-2 type transport system ATP-binding protein